MKRPINYYFQDLLLFGGILRIFIIAIIVAVTVVIVDPYSTLADSSNREDCIRAKGFLDIGNNWLKARQYPQAIANFTKAITLNPKYEDAYLGRAQANCELKQYNKEIADLSKAIALNSKSVLAYCSRADAYCELKQYQKAIDDCSKAISLDSQSTCQACIVQGAAYFELKQYQKAIDSFSKGIDGWTNLRHITNSRSCPAGKLVMGLVTPKVLGPVYYARAQAYEKIGKPDFAKADIVWAKEYGYKPEQER